MNENDLASVDWVVNKLGLSDLPKKRTYEIIAAKVSHQLFEMYFDEAVVGTNATTGIEMLSDENDFSVGAVIANGYSIIHEGTKVATNLDTYHISGKFLFAINEYSFHEEKFYPSDSKGTWHKQKLVDVDLVSFDKSQVASCASSNNLGRAKGEQGLLKALALLAREMAENGSPKFRSGNKVNATAIKDHIISLANKNEISTGYLKSLDDVLNRVLKDLDLKEIPPNQ